DHPFLQRLEATIAALPTAALGVILRSGSERVFVAGADLKTIDTWDDQQLDRYLAYGSRVFAMLAELPCPTAAVISGAVLGHGLVGAPPPRGRPHPPGLPEAGLSIGPGWGGTNLFPARIHAPDAIMHTATGATMMFDEAAKAGLFDAVAPSASDLLTTAHKWL